MIRTAAIVLATILATALSVAQPIHRTLPGGAPVPTCDPRKPDCCKTVGLCRR